MTPPTFDFAFIRLSVSTITTHTQPAFHPEDAKVVYSVGRSLLAYVKASRMGALDMMLANPAKLPTATINAACDLLFALRKAYKNALATPSWPDDPLPATDPALDRKRGPHSVDSKGRRDHSGGASSSRGSSSRSAASSTRPKSVKLGKGPRQRSSSAKAAYINTDSDGQICRQRKKIRPRTGAKSVYYGGP